MFLSFMLNHVLNQSLIFNLSRYFLSKEAYIYKMELIFFGCLLFFQANTVIYMPCDPPDAEEWLAQRQHQTC